MTLKTLLSETISNHFYDVLESEAEDERFILAKTTEEIDISELCHFASETALRYGMISFVVRAEKDGLAVDVQAGRDKISEIEKRGRKISIRNHLEVRNGYATVGKGKKFGEYLWDEHKDDAVREFFYEIEGKACPLLDEMLSDLVDMTENFHHPQTNIRVEIKVIAEDLKREIAEVEE